MKKETIDILTTAKVDPNFIADYEKKADDTIESNQTFWKNVVDNSVSPTARINVIDKVTAISDMTEGLLLDYIEHEIVDTLPK